MDEGLLTKQVVEIWEILIPVLFLLIAGGAIYTFFSSEGIEANYLAIEISNLASTINQEGMSISLPVSNQTNVIYNQGSINVKVGNSPGISRNIYNQTPINIRTQDNKVIIRT